MLITCFMPPAALNDPLEEIPAIGEAGARALARMLADGGAPVLAELMLGGTHAELAEACRRRDVTLT